MALLYIVWWHYTKHRVSCMIVEVKGVEDTMTRGYVRVIDANNVCRCRCKLCHVNPSHQRVYGAHNPFSSDQST